MRECFESAGAGVWLNTPAHFAVRILREIADFTSVARAANSTAD
jgi:hypothetical protein